MTSLITGLGGSTGFGADALERSDDGGSSVIDLTAIFGPQGLSFYGSRQTALVISTNGHVTFGVAASPFFSHEVMTLAGTPPTIAPYFADADTQGGSATASAGGTSTGSNQVWYHADASNGGSLVITWDDVGPFGGAAGQNAFQMVISGTGDGNFALELRYENIEWTTWDLAGGVGFSAGDGRHYQLLPASGDAAALTALDSTVGNTGEIGVYRYQFIGGQPDAVTGAVTLSGTDGEDILAGTEQADRLDGGLGNDSLVGDRGDDTLVGGGGRDTLSGDLGDDTYRVDSLDDDVLEDIDEGIDTVEALGLSMTLGYQVENLRLLGDAALRLDGTGNALDNRLVGHAGDNLLDGGGGDDTMIGGAGNDTYRVDSSGDRIIENADEGVDTIETALSFTVAENVENLTLLGSADIDATGSAQANRLTGNAGNNRLDGAAGRDTLVGGAGNDTYLVDDAGDVVIELAGEGTDQVQAALSWTLGDQIENLQLLGAAALSGTGNTLANTLTGNSAANRLEGLAGDDTLDGGAGSDTLVGGAGNDTYLVDSAGDRTIERSASDGIDSVLSSVSFVLEAYVENLTLLGSASLSGTGNALANTLAGNAGDNLLSGEDGNDSLVGGAGNDSLYGGAGSDTMAGGTGDDFYRVGLSSDVVVELAGEGIDSVEAVNTSFTLSDQVENLTLSGAAYYINATGNALANRLVGNWGYNVLTGGAGNDTLDGGEGADTLVGGTGDDLYLVNSGADVITELAGEGTDLVLSTARSFTLGANVENLTMAGTGSISATGNALANTMIGNSGDNVLDGGDGNDSLVGGAGFDSLLGGAGADTMAGGADSDFYRVGSSLDVVVEEAGGGLNDTVEAWVSYTLGANVENLTLGSTAALGGTGNGLNNVLTGNAASNVLDGLAGADTMAGGAGNDTYFVDSAADVVNEAAGNGIDLVNASVSYTLKANVEKLTLTGSANLSGYGGDDANTLTGNAGNNLLDGGAGNDTLYGNAGNDTLYGNAGDDSMLGGTGDDLYRVASVGDTVVELAGEGSDSVEAYLSWTLAANVENATLYGSATALTGNALANRLVGNALANSLSGGDGADTLSGAAGADTLAGGSGADTYLFARGDGADTLQENDASAGSTDLLAFSSGIATEQLWFRHLGNDLEVSIIGTSDKATVKDWYLGAQHQIEQMRTSDGQTLLAADVDALVNAMAAFSAPASGQTSLPQNLLTALAPVIAAAWN